MERERLRGLLVVVGALALLLACPAGFAQSAQDLQSEIARTRDEISSLQNQVTQFNSDNAALGNRVSQLQRELQSLEEKEAALKKKNRQLQTRLSYAKGAAAAENPHAASRFGLKDLTQDSASGKTAAKSKPNAKKRAPNPRRGPKHR